MSTYRDAQPPGFEITEELRTWDSQRKCPRCAIQIYAGEKDGFRIEACGNCGGVWLEDEQGKRAVTMDARAPEELAAKVEKVTRAMPFRVNDMLLCPDCSAPMEQRILNNATVDVCHAHGTWFDRTELSTVMRARRGDFSAAVTSVESLFLEEQELRKRSMFGPELKEVRERLGRLLALFFNPPASSD